MLAALEAQRLLADEHDVGADVWSATSYQQLRNDALEVERWNRLHPTGAQRRAYVVEAFGELAGPVVAVTDFVKAVPDQIARWVPQPFVPLGTDGFGLSDARAPLRRHFEVDAAHVVVAALDGLAQRGDVKVDVVAAAIDRYGIDSDALDPRDA
jgi:pyruvate dehydrogenase E1 component